VARARVTPVSGEEENRGDARGVRFGGGGFSTGCGYKCWRVGLSGSGPLKRKGFRNKIKKIPFNAE
jgi:hypothetical protein